jgi:hypothetical protein
MLDPMLFELAILFLVSQQKDEGTTLILRYSGDAGKAPRFPRSKLNVKENIVPSDFTDSGNQGSPDQQSPTTSSAPATGYTPVAAPAFAVPAKSGPSALKIILIIVAIVVGLGILGAGAFGFMVWRIAHAVHVTGPNGQFTMNTPNGTLTANSNETFTSSDLGTDIYPGAQPGKGSMRMTLPTGSVVSAVYVTSDSKDQVVNYYKGKFGSDASTFDTGSSAIITVNKGKQESIMVTISVSPSQYDGKTQIHIVHSINNKPS